MCLSEGTVTCWYHGYTYSVDDGSLTTIVGNPDDSLIGRAAIRTYPVEEVNGMIFVFVGDADYGTRRRSRAICRCESPTTPTTLPSPT